MLEETNDHWLYDDMIIFKPYFNNKLDNCYKIVNKCKKIIFLNYIEINDEIIKIDDEIFKLKSPDFILGESNSAEKEEINVEDE